MVVAIDMKGERIPEYQNLYHKVRENVLKNAAPDAVFYHVYHSSPILRKVERDNW
jgi:hypothetical protein